MKEKHLYLLNLIACGLLTSIVAGALAFQLVYKELPCPLCWLQRVGLLSISIAFLFNLKNGLGSKYYGLALLGTLFTFSVATRQVFLHILPGDPGFSSTVLGLHLYSWVVIICLCLFFGISMLLCLHKQLLEKKPTVPILYQQATKAIYYYTLAIVVLNVFAAFHQCGFGYCPE